MPKTAFEIFNQLKLYSGADDQNGLPQLPKTFIRAVASGHKINKPTPLFKKLEEKEVLELKQMYSGAPTAKSSPSVTSDYSNLTSEKLQEMVTAQVRSNYA